MNIAFFVHRTSNSISINRAKRAQGDFYAQREGKLYIKAK